MSTTKKLTLKISMKIYKFLLIIQWLKRRRKAWFKSIAINKDYNSIKSLNHLNKIFLMISAILEAAIFNMIISLDLIILLLISQIFRRSKNRLMHSTLTSKNLSNNKPNPSSKTMVCLILISLNSPSRRLNKTK
jgi:hypothetical protein